MESLKKKKQAFSLYIIGTTAAGKTKLSLSLAQRFGGEIVSADSMQMYRHADILTAKATAAEQAIAKHHMLDIFDLPVANINRNDYFHLARNAFDDVHSRGSFPIVIGGTNYYIETLLFNQKIEPNRIDRDDANAYFLELQAKKDMLAETKDSIAGVENEDYDRNEAEEDEKNKNDDNITTTTTIASSPSKQAKKDLARKSIALMTPREKYDRLAELDPILANKLHVNDERRIESYLEKALSSGVKPSESYENHETIPLRDPNCLIFWPKCKSKGTLDAQIAKRINEMISAHGIQEAFLIFRTLVPKDVENDKHPVFLKGVLQSIGYKEFFPFFQYFNTIYSLDSDPVSEEEDLARISKLMNEDEAGKQIMKNCVDTLVLHTSQYTKRQLKWIKHRIMINSDSEEIKKRLYIFEFDEYTAEDFDEKAIRPAMRILERYLCESLETSSVEEDKTRSLTIEELAALEPTHLVSEEEFVELRKGHSKKGLEDWKKHYCDVCKKEINGERDWPIHLTSKSHKRAIKSIEKAAARAVYAKLAEEKKLALTSDVVDPGKEGTQAGVEEAIVEESNITSQQQ